MVSLHLNWSKGRADAAQISLPKIRNSKISFPPNLLLSDRGASRARLGARKRVLNPANPLLADRSLLMHGVVAQWLRNGMTRANQNWLRDFRNREKTQMRKFEIFPNLVLVEIFRDREIFSGYHWKTKLEIIIVLKICVWTIHSIGISSPANIIETSQ